MRRIRSASAPTAERSPPRRTGTGRCKSMTVRPALPESYERLCHDNRHAAVPAAAAHPGAAAVNEQLDKPRLERAIGVIYRPETELAEPLLSSDAAAAVRRVHLVRPNQGRVAAEDREDRGPAGHLSIRTLTRTLAGCSDAGSGGFLVAAWRFLLGLRRGLDLGRRNPTCDASRSTRTSAWDFPIWSPSSSY